MSRRRGCFLVVLVVLALVLLLAVAVVVYGRQASQAALAEAGMPGELVQVGDHRLHVLCSGSGGTTVFIDAGNASFSLDWAGVQPLLASETRVCTYDRAGYGWSDPPTSPRDAAHIVEELHALIAAVDAAPVVLVGHSQGALHTLLYTTTYPEDVAGLVLVDPPEPGAVYTPEYATMKAQSRGFYQSMRLLAGLGLLPLIGGSDESLPETARTLPQISDDYLAMMLKTTLYETAIAELDSIETSARQVDDALAAAEGSPPLGDLPLIVLSAQFDENLSRAQLDARSAGHRDLAALSTRGRQRTVPNTEHVMQFDAPEAIVAAALEVAGR